jgi:hypothetical protein
VTDVLNNVRSALTAANHADVQSVKPAPVVPDETNPDALPAQTSTPPAIADDLTVPKRSSNWSANNPAESFVRRLSEPTSTVEARTVDGLTDNAMTVDPPADTGLQRTALTCEPLTFLAHSYAMTTHDLPDVMPAAPEALSAQPTNFLTNVLSVLGIGAQAGNIPGAPVGSPVVLAALAWASRRETVETFSTTAESNTTTRTPVATAALSGAAPNAGLTSAAPTAAVTTPQYPSTTRKPTAVSTNTDFIDFVTGPDGLNSTETRFGIGGGDVGIMWDNGIEDDPTTQVNEHQVLIALGDTFGNSYPVRTGVWRMNVLLRSPDNTLSNGLYIPNGVADNGIPGYQPAAAFSGSPMTNPNFAREIIGSPGKAVGPEVTIIPTAGISGPGPDGGTRQYVNFMSVRSWDTPGRWTTNYSGIAYSDDNGET